MKHAPRPQGLIFDIMADDGQRGKGYGKQALLALDVVAKEMGVETCRCMFSCPIYLR